MASYTVICVGILACMLLMSGSYSIPLPIDSVEDEGHTIEAKFLSDNTSHLSLVHALLHHLHEGIDLQPEGHSNTTEGPDHYLANSTESSVLLKKHPLLHDMNPLMIHSHILVNKHSSKTPITIEKAGAEGVSIQITTKIDFGEKRSSLGSRLGPLIFNNNFNLQVPDINKPKEKDYHHSNAYNDDEDYYMYEGSGDHSAVHQKNTFALNVAATTVHSPINVDMTTVDEI